ncbi:AI-2E family transporter, partial [Rhodoblastus sp.]|uniref:AI-2E family transporter n=1 Tax=Rhodoblastus sp. TaxID=1962975 RepID=UPI0035B3240E
MNNDLAAKASLILCALVILLAAAFVARPIIAPVTFAIFIVAVVWPLQGALQNRIPKLAALVVTLLCTLAVIFVLGYLMIWAFSLVAQWLISNTARFQSLYAQAADWLEGHGIAVKTLMETGFSPAWITGAVRGIGGQGYGLLSFVVIAFAFTVLGLLEVEIAQDNISRLDNPGLREALLKPAQEISAKFQKYMMVRSTMSALTGAVVWVFALIAGMELATAWGVIAFVLN